MIKYFSIVTLQNFSINKLFQGSFDIVQTDNHVDFYRKGTLEKWFTFDLTDNTLDTNAYKFTVLKDGMTQNEDMNFKVKAGPPTETLSVNSVFENTKIVSMG